MSEAKCYQDTMYEDITVKFGLARRKTVLKCRKIKLLRQGYKYHKLRKRFQNFYQRHFDIVFEYNVGLKTLLLQGLSEPECSGDLVNKFSKIIGKNDFPYHFKKDNCPL